MTSACAWTVSAIQVNNCTLGAVLSLPKTPGFASCLRERTCLRCAYAADGALRETKGCCGAWHLSGALDVAALPVALANSSSEATRGAMRDKVCDGKAIRDHEPAEQQEKGSITWFYSAYV